MQLNAINFRWLPCDGTPGQKLAVDGQDDEPTRRHRLCWCPITIAFTAAAQSSSCEEKTNTTTIPRPGVGTTVFQTFNLRLYLQLYYTNVTMPTLAVTDFNIVCATAGGFILCFGLVSYLCKERLFLSEAREW